MAPTERNFEIMKAAVLAGAVKRVCPVPWVNGVAVGLVERGWVSQVGELLTG